MALNDKINGHGLEAHPLFPSGEWTGFYCYRYNSEQHRMLIEFTFLNSIVSGSGVDDISSFTWTGKYDIEKFKVEMIKYYATHEVLYKGDVDENGIWGTWEIVYDNSKFPEGIVESMKEAFKNDITGGFHIWPKKREAKSEVQEKQNNLDAIKLEEFKIKC